MDKTTFALFIGNRGFFPAALLAEAREELPRVLKGLGHEVLMLDAAATRYGAVETPREGEIYANFLRENRGKYGGVILSLPNFGDETGAIAALKDADVPILIHGYPDEMDKMGPAVRRDAFCGKLSIMDVFNQNGLKFTALKPHVVSPTSERFKANVDHFDRVCRARLRSRLCGLTRLPSSATASRWRRWISPTSSPECGQSTPAERPTKPRRRLSVTIPPGSACRIKPLSRSHV